jgi:predicted helicase
VHEIQIAQVDGKKINPQPENFEVFVNLIQNFCTYVSQTIKSPKKLAEMMAAKARLLENILEKAITTDEDKRNNSELQQQYDTFKEILIHDLTPQGFADIYAQTLAYGMFAARLHDKTLDTFSRQEAAELIPKSNPFLRKLFDHLAGANIDERIVTTVDNLADVFRATNVEELLKNFGKSTQTQDPIIHFYETFLAEYDPKLRKSRGVWYTPEPVVNFIVRGVDEILKTEFGLSDGLADTSKTTVEVEVQGTAVTKGKAKGKRLTENKEVHKVQVLDPATGTGTFLAEVVKFIYNKKFKAMQGAWTGYVEEHLIPRLNGFELLMASYSMAHLKLDMLLSETGYQAKGNQRFNIFLTNSLEEHHPDTGTLFSSWLSTEANEANSVKRDTPIMVVMGNPPYSVSSSNKGKWISALIEDYKKELNEKKINLDDDYIKFIKYGQYFIDKNGEGILAYISNNSFIDGITHRKMREDLLGSFDKIYVLDLHGSTKKNEKSLDGSADENVFDIQQGVCITFFIKKTSKKNKGEVFHSEIFGKRAEKYEYLSSHNLKEIDWNKLKMDSKYYFFQPRDFSCQAQYETYFSLKDLFPIYNSGIKTDRDKLFISFTEREVEEKFKALLSEELDESFIET